MKKKDRMVLFSYQLFMRVSHVEGISDFLESAGGFFEKMFLFL